MRCANWQGDSFSPRIVLRKKLFSLFIALASLTVLVSAIGVASLRLTIRAKDQLVERYSQVEVSVARLWALSERRARKLRAYLLTGHRRHLEDRVQALAQFQAALYGIDQWLQPDEKALLDAVRDADVRLRPVVEKIAGMRSRGESFERVRTYMVDELQPRREALDESIKALVNHVKEQNIEQTARANRRVANASALLGSSVALALVSAVLLGLTLFRATRALAAEQGALERAARYQKEVMGVIGHDLRSPLAAIIATASLTERSDMSKEDRRRMERILRSARRIEALAGVLLDFTRFEAPRRVPLVLQDADFHELVMERLRHVAEGRAVDLDLSGDGSARLDVERLGHAVQAVLEHAFAHAPQGFPVRVRSRGEGSTVALEVSFGGPPISGELLRRMFEPFARAHDGGDTIQLSQGIGLFLAREIVTAHSGTMDVRSPEDAGLVVRIHLPREPRVEPPAAVSRETERAATGEGPAHRA